MKKTKRFCKSKAEARCSWQVVSFARVDCRRLLVRIRIVIEVACVCGALHGWPQQRRLDGTPGWVETEQAPVLIVQLHLLPWLRLRRLLLLLLLRLRLRLRSPASPPLAQQSFRLHLLSHLFFHLPFSSSSSCCCCSPAVIYFTSSASSFSQYCNCTAASTSTRTSPTCSQIQ